MRTLFPRQIRRVIGERLMPIYVPLFSHQTARKCQDTRTHGHGTGMGRALKDRPDDIGLENQRIFVHEV